MAIVLHVSECLGGGVESAIAQYINESPASTEHHVLAISGRNNDSNGLVAKSRVCSLERASCSPLFAPLTVFRKYQELNADYVHLHSSFAGLFGRLSPVPRKKLIYTPHCYAFQITDGGALKRFLYFAVENFLAIRTGKFAACGLHEASLSRQFLVKRPVVSLNNAVDMPLVTLGLRSGVVPRIGMLGRVCGQKGVDFFASCVHSLRALGLECRFVWIGGGSPAAEKSLRDIGVEVTGWLAREHAIAELRRLDVYVHSAAWEGNPVALIEASFLGLPVFARSIPSIAVYGEELCFKLSSDMALAIVKYWGDPNGKCNALELASRIRAGNTIDGLRAALACLYSVT